MRVSLDDGFTASLAAFSLTSKKYRSAASAVLARTIKFVVSGLDKYPGYLEQDVTQCYRSLDRDQNFPRVRRLVVAGLVTPPDFVHPEAATSTRSKGDGWKPRITAAEMVDDETRIDGWFQETQVGHNGRHFGWDEFTIAKVPNGFWKPLAKLIKKLPRLTDLLYACPNQFPPCMLDALHEYHPRCRLHMRNFHLHSIVDKPINVPVPDDEETANKLRLASSPCLYSVRYSYAFNYGTYEEWNNGVLEPNPNSIHNSAVMRIVTKMAPNLKKVHLRPASDPSSQSFPPEPWKAAKDLSLTQSPAPLTSMEMEQDLGVSEEVIKLWRESTDMSLLRVLKLTKLEGPALRELAKCILPSLVHLNISLPFVDSRSYWDVVAEALRGISPNLLALKLGGLSSQIPLKSFLGPCLRTLDVATHNSRVFKEKDILEVAKRSPLLECLTLRILRRKGDGFEVAAYRALGNFKRLRDLTITLVVRPPPITRATLEEMDVQDMSGFEREIWRVTENKVPKRHQHPPGFTMRDLKTAVINSAVDAQLVRSIVDVISASKQRSAAVSLECLRVDVTGYDQFKMDNQDDAEYPFGEYCALIGLPWVAKRNVNSENRADYSVLPGRDKKDIFRRDKAPIEEAGGIFLYLVEMLWPRAAPTTDLVGRAWHSFPLLTDKAIDSPQNM
ncbi:hypothetical protein CGMCC3_g9958 [Colletotrichum fructicola]|uniref:Uncharacterized protein n=1 Tax=Colletotrichum fructicola (strain Nara gc5) TaxID=1213859 RepID=A0A7J6IWV1_COLFN|nr:uncharacterized protein CGMCC3_g9958 [Colletotrichum fructicola]KAE9574082.1 hypothetical protein CGMCC3_g9958 [Colletotrichum fructicola]KAF4481764.1 hypothetical protein CGGC5_v009977 [Colletotrichum fructicola Nara gc5]KAF4937866.1 hypothetical protein CGCF245_v005155 [Colletotrichum fructicola]